jgi:hypothetical protein
MSERLSLPPMQYVSPEDGRPDHGAIRPGRAARFNLGRAGPENLGFLAVRCSSALRRSRCRTWRTDTSQSDLMPGSI